MLILSSSRDVGLRFPLTFVSCRTESICAVVRPNLLVVLRTAQEHIRENLLFLAFDLNFMPVVPEENPEDLRPELKEVQENATPEEVVEPPPQLFHPLNWEILALLMPASVFGVLARLGLAALTSYDGESIFPLAYVQGFGCLIMGFCLTLKVPISEWCV